MHAYGLAVDLNPFDSETLIASAEGMAMLGRLSEAAPYTKISAP